MNTPTFIVLAMSTPVIILLVVVAVFIAALVGLYFYAKKMERKQVEAQEQMKAVAQSVSMLIIDKRRILWYTIQASKKAYLPEWRNWQTPGT